MGNHHLIIGGTTKAATTSLFNYLAAHPEVCPATLKETRFFLDSDYPVVVRRVFDDTPDAYDTLFQGCNNGLRLEATPDYMYSPGTPARIEKALSNVKLLFVLRNPIDRLLSWYRFAQQNAQLDEDTSFDAYVNKQLLADPQAPVAQHMMALEQGRYSRYLAPYFQRFGVENLLVQWFEDLVNVPRLSLKSICAFAGLHDGYYDDFEFTVHNRTLNMRQPKINRLYRTMKAAIRKRTYRIPWAHKHLRKVSRTLEPYYLCVNACPNSSVSMSLGTRKRLSDFYTPESRALQELLNLPQEPWPDLADATTTRRGLGS